MLLHKKCSYSELFWSQNTERYSVSLRIQSECAKIQTRITPNTDTFHAVIIISKLPAMMLLLNFTDVIKKKFLVCKLYIGHDIKFLIVSNLSMSISAVTFKFMSYMEINTMKNALKFCHVPLTAQK